MIDGGGLRHNQGKLRLDLVPVSLDRAVAAVLQQACERSVNPYPERNWERGMPWSKVTASLLRHLAAWRAGEDNDPETGLPHLWHIACNVAFLIEYQETCPRLDDRRGLPPLT
jgi:hypothetical protein